MKSVKLLACRIGDEARGVPLREAFFWERQRDPVNRDAAQALALQALAFVAGDEDALRRLMAESGLGQADLAARASDPEFLGFVVDFVLSQESLAEGFCTVAEVSAETIRHARVLLPGAATDWP